MNSVPLKRCSKCGIEKPATTEVFASDKRLKSGIRPYCKACDTKITRKRYAERYARPRQPFVLGSPKTCAKCKETKPGTQEFFAPRQGRPYQPLRSSCRDCESAATRSRRAENPEPFRAKERARHAQNPELYRERSRLYRKQNLERLRAKDREKYARNREALRAYHSRYFQEHKEEKREYRRLWRARNPLSDRVKKAKRRALKQAAGGAFTKSDLARQVASQCGKCYWCGEPLPADFHADHIIPLSKGGSNGPENICASCPTCNTRKHNKMPWEFAGRLF